MLNFDFYYLMKGIYFIKKDRELFPQYLFEKN